MKNSAEKIDGAIAHRLTITNVLLCLLGITLVGRLILVFTYEVNWDEFFFLAFVYEFQEGTLAQVLQTFHVRGFGWLPEISKNEVDQIIAARVVMWVFNVATVFFVYAASLKFTSKDAALFAALSYSAFTLVIQNGASFRTDPIAAFFLMAAIWLVLSERARFFSACLAGVCVAFAGMVTIKSVFYVPTLVICMFGSYLLAVNGKAEIKRFLGFVFCVALTFGLLYVWHKSAVVLANSEANTTMLSHSYSKTINLRALFPQWGMLWRSVVTNPLYWGALGIGVFVTVKHIFYKENAVRVKALIILGFVLPILSFVFYRNSFPYFYAYILPPASLLCAVGYKHIKDTQKSSQTPPLLAIAIIIIGTTFLTTFVVALGKSASNQRAVLAVIHQMFPTPVSYIDRCSMVASFNKIGFFMSSWGMENYYTNQRPIMQVEISSGQPKFLLANIGSLKLKEQNQGTSGPAHYGFFAEDIAVLKDNFIPHWGPIYVAGKSIRVAANSAPVSFAILIAGQYTLEGESAVVIDGKKIVPGDKVFLNPGSHTLSTDGMETHATLRWGNNLYRPKESPPEGPVFRGF